MGELDGIPLLLTSAEATLIRSQKRLAQLKALLNEQGGKTEFVNGLRIATAEIEVAVVGTFSLFESRMQDSLPQGSFFKQLVERLNVEGQACLGARVHQYHLAVNLLKHGRGWSYQKLRAIPDLPFSVKQPEDYFFDEGDVAEPEGLVDVLAPSFFDGLIETLRQVNLFLEADKTCNDQAKDF